MLRMPRFEVHLPRTGSEAVALRASLPQSTYVAGGTDLLPNLKHGLAGPKHLISLSHVAEFGGIAIEEDGTLRLGAGTSLQTIADSDRVRSFLPALASAAGSVAGPQHRRMGTLGGNVMLDTRCLFYNQTELWREALGYCLKREGDFCHVIGSEARCVAAQSADTVPVLIAAGAIVEFATPDGRAEIDLGSLYNKDGRHELVFNLSEEALVTAVRIPPQRQEHRSLYRKVRARGSVDFPQLGLALVSAFDGPSVEHLTAVVSAVLPRPIVLRGLDAAHGTELEDEVIDKLGELTYKQVTPQTSIHGLPDWRRQRARVEMRRGLEELRRDATAATL